MTLLAVRGLRSGYGQIEVLHGVDVSIDSGDIVHIPHLADTLAAIADEGAGLFYAGELGQRISAHVMDGEGALTRADLEQEAERWANAGLSLQYA